MVWGTGEHVDSLRRQLVRNLGCLDGLGELVVDTLGESRGHVGRTEYSPPRVNLETGHTLARNRLGARELGIGFGRSYGDGAQPTGSHVGAHQKHRSDGKRNLIADRIVHQRAAAAIGDVVELDSQLIAELRHRQVAEASRSDRPIGHAPGFRLGGSNDVPERLVRLADVRDQCHSAGADEHDRCEVS